MSFLNSIIYKAVPSALQAVPRTTSLPVPNQSPGSEGGLKVPRPRQLEEDTQSNMSGTALLNIPVLPNLLLLDDFEIHRTLGTGSFGRVHLVRYKTTRQYFAMKVLKKTEVVRLKQVEHIRNEKAILTRTHHPLLVNMVGSFQDATNLYMVLELVQGGEMFTYLRKFQASPFLILLIFLYLRARVCVCVCFLPRL